jgi:hypothetical protein
MVESLPCKVELRPWITLATESNSFGAPGNDDPTDAYGGAGSHGHQTAKQYYRLSAAGRKELAVEESKWKHLVGAIARVAARAES